jgi:hypothetical protein
VFPQLLSPTYKFTFDQTLINTFLFDAKTFRYKINEYEKNKVILVLQSKNESKIYLNQFIKNEFLRFTQSK